MVVKILLNSWATLEANVPTLLRRWARSSCSRSCSVSFCTAASSSPIMEWPPRRKQVPDGGADHEGKGRNRLGEFGLDMVSAAQVEALHPKSLLSRVLRKSIQAKTGNGASVECWEACAVLPIRSVSCKIPGSNQRTPSHFAAYRVVG